MKRLPSLRHLAIYLDLLLLGAVLLAYSPRATGLAWHEWIGIALIVPTLLHLLLSWSWISAGARAFQRARPRSRVNFILNLLLFILFVLEITSGMMISQVALHSFGIQTVDDRAWRALHNLGLNWMLLLLGLHLAMNWHPLLLGLRRYLGFGAAGE